MFLHMHHKTSWTLCNPNHSCQTKLIDFVDEIQPSMNDRHKLNLIFIDFSKVFDTVPHIRLLTKLKFYGIRGPLHHQISAWLMRREQRIVVGGESFNATPVKSGVPQDTVLGPLMFLVYINDINENIRSSVWLFADDCIIYKPIKTTRCRTPTRRLTNIIWYGKWKQMSTNVLH